MNLNCLISRVKTRGDVKHTLIEMNRHVYHEAGESRLLWGGLLIWGNALFHTRRCCALCLRM